MSRATSLTIICLWALLLPFAEPFFGFQQQRRRPEPPARRPRRGEISEACEWIKDSVWKWNKWRQVQFKEDGTFISPTNDCQAGRCYWGAIDNQVHIAWGDAGWHTVNMNHRERTMAGHRDSDGDQVTAAYVSGGGRNEVALAAEEAERCVLTENDDAYDILGVDAEADDAVIKKAFRKLSREFHPDKYRGDDKEGAECKFNQIRMAYEVVSDHDKRFLYDSGGLEAVQNNDKQEAGGGAMDPFAAFFGGGRQQQQGNKGPDFTAQIDVTLENLYNGGAQEVTFKRRVVCRGCGKPKKNKKRPQRCSLCGKCPPETKMVQRQMAPGFMVQQQERVPSKERCKQEDTTVKAEIERGMAEGHELRFERMSEQTPGQIPGDVILKLKIQPHRIFRREGNDLHYKMRITLREALTGFTRTITHLDGHQVTIKKDPSANKRHIVRPGQVDKVAGEGMPVHEVPSEFGVLHVAFEIDFPAALSEPVLAHACLQPHETLLFNDARTCPLHREQLGTLRSTLP